MSIVRLVDHLETGGLKERFSSHTSKLLEEYHGIMQGRPHCIEKNGLTDPSMVQLVMIPGKISLAQYVRHLPDAMENEMIGIGVVSEEQLAAEQEVEWGSHRDPDQVDTEVASD